jgi:hypothetical protein
MNNNLKDINMNVIKSIFQFLFLIVGATSTAAVLMAICMATM